MRESSSRKRYAAGRSQSRASHITLIVLPNDFTLGWRRSTIDQLSTEFARGRTRKGLKSSTLNMCNDGELDFLYLLFQDCSAFHGLRLLMRFDGGASTFAVIPRAFNLAIRMRTRYS